MDIQPLVVRQEKLSKKLKERGITSKVSMECVDEEKRLLEEFKNKNPSKLNAEKLLFLKQCSREREKSLELLDN